MSPKCPQSVPNVSPGLGCPHCPQHPQTSGHPQRPPRLRDVPSVPLLSPQPHAQSLETLNLGHNPIGNEGVRNLKTGLIGNRSVLRLGLASTKLTCEGGGGDGAPRGRGQCREGGGTLGMGWP